MKTENGARWLQDLVHRASARIHGIFPLGITARLAISFMAVAALAAAANLIAQESVSVILWSKRAPAPASPTVDLLRMQNAPALAAIGKKQVEGLVSAVDRFGLASQLRAETNS